MTVSAQGDAPAARPDDGAPAVRPDDIAWIARDVWSSFLDIDLVPAPAPSDGGDEPDVLTGVIEVTGAWDGSVEVRCAAMVARALAAAMLAAAADAVTAADVVDALGELTNMVGGNVKSLLPAPSRLSLPAVRSGPRPDDGSRLVSRVDLAPAAGDATRDVLSITVWQR